MRNILITAAFILPCAGLHAQQFVVPEIPGGVYRADSTYMLAPADTAKTVSLQDCLEVGLERNYSLRIVRNEEQAALNNATRGAAGQLPSVGLGVSYSGTLYDNSYRMRDGSSDRQRSALNDNLFAGVDMQWTVFDGFRLETEYKSLKERYVRSGLETRLAVEDYVASLAAEYYNLIRQKRRLQNLRLSVDLSRERLRIVQESYLIGSASGLDFQQAQVDFNSDLSDLLAQNEVVNASRIALNRLMAADDPEVPVNIADTAILPDTAFSRAVLWDKALANNVSLLAARSDRLLSELDYKKARGRSYPYLRLDAGYGYRHYWYDYSNYKRQDQLGLTFGVTAGITLFDGMNARREQRNARLAAENRELAVRDIENALRADLANLWFAYRNNVELWEIEKRNLTVARRNYEIAMERYMLRELSGIELREAQLSLILSEERLSTSEYNIKVCEISLLQLSGDVLMLLQ